MINHTVAVLPSRHRALRSAAIAVGLLAGGYALVMLAVGTPFQFGVALALCSACWIAADCAATAAAPVPAARPGTPPAAERIMPLRLDPPAGRPPNRGGRYQLAPFGDGHNAAAERRTHRTAA